MFRGINHLSLDTKGRAAMPAKYRDRLLDLCAGNLVLTIDPANSAQEPCLLLYPLPEWEVIQSKIQTLSSFNPVSRKVQRLLIGHAEDLQMDNSGRILLPSALRDFARMDKKVVLIGQGKRLEMWDEATWQSCRESWLGADLNENESLPNELNSLSL